MQAVILAGGKGTRLKELTETIPKPLIPIGDKPILQHQIEFLAGQGITDVWILIGYLGEKIRSYFGNGDRFGIAIHYSDSGIEANTVDRVLALRDVLTEDFLLLYGDVMMNFDLQKFIDCHNANQRGQIATVAVGPLNYIADVAEVAPNGFLKAWHAKPHAADFYYHNLGNVGVNILSANIFALLEQHPGTDFGHFLFPWALKNGHTIFTYTTSEYFKDMGTLERLPEVNEDYRTGVIARSSIAKKRPAVFLDRDGVIIEQVDHLHRLADVQLFPWAGKAIAKLNHAGFVVVVVTNQSAIARGLMSEQDLHGIHNKIETQLLGSSAAISGGFYYCPHHPSEGVNSAYVMDCNCRKPKTGLIEQAARDLNLDLEKSWFVGDMTGDALLSEQAGLKFLGVLTGHACKDGRYSVKKEFPLYANLLEAVKEIIK